MDDEQPESGIMRFLEKVVAIVLVLAFGLPGIGMSIYLYRMNQAVEAQRDWTVVEALNVTLPEKARGEFPHEEVRYTYEINGQTFSGSGCGGTRIRTNGVDRELKEWVSTTRTRLKQQSNVPCWVNPSAPTESTLIRKSPSFIPYFIGIFTFSHGLLGIGFFFLAFFGGGKIGPDRTSNENGDLFAANDQNGDKKALGLGPRRAIQAIGVLFWCNAYLWPSIQMLQYTPSELELSWAPQSGQFWPWLFIGISGVILCGFGFLTLKR